LYTLKLSRILLYDAVRWTYCHGVIFGSISYSDEILDFSKIS